ncbi:MAG: hypothetical protein JW986_06185 [Methanotrichaceae archaeon]|nr:hypothetical protein [Methanotrichaceae archaeon]
MGCDHIDCGQTEKVWLPSKYMGRDRGLRPHLYCVKCGMIKTVSSEKPRGVGYYINVVASLSSSYRITKIQMRLIVHEFEKIGLGDHYGMDLHTQEKLFVGLVRKYVNIPEEIVRSSLDPYRCLRCEPED